MKIYETERLIIRRAVLTDAQFFYDLLNSQPWLDNIGDRGVTDLKKAEAYIEQKIIPDYERSGFGMYCIHSKADNHLIGNTGLVDRPGLEGIDIGFALLPAFGGKGYGYEASAPLIQHARDHGLKLLKAITLPRNIPSRKLLEKLGLKFIKDFYMEGDPELLSYYEMEL